MPHDAQLLSLGFSPMPTPKEGLAPREASFLYSNQVVRWFMQMPESAPVLKVGINISALSQFTPIAPFEIRLRSVNEFGSPGNVLVGVGGNAECVFTAASTGFQFIPLDHTYNASWGEFICIELRPHNPNPDQDPPVFFNNGIDVHSSVEGWSPNFINNPYVQHVALPTSGAPWPIVALQSRSRSYGYPLQDLSSLPAASRACMRFKLPSGFGPAGNAKFKVAGVRIRRATSALGGLGGKLRLWKHDVSAPLQSVDFDGGWMRSGISGAQGDVYSNEPLASLDYGVEYFVGLIAHAPVDAVTVAANAHLDALPGGREVYAATYDDFTSTWNREDKKRLFWDLILAEM